MSRLKLLLFIIISLWVTLGYCQESKNLQKEQGETKQLPAILGFPEVKELPAILGFSAEFSDYKSIQKGNEIISLRNANSKTFQNNDGSRTLRTYENNIHYKSDDGNWNDIDTTIKPSSEPNYEYQMQDSMYKVRLKKYFDEKDFLEVTQNGATYKVTALPLYWENEKGQKELIASPRHVEGIPQNSSIVYTNAYGPGLDFKVDLSNIKFDKWLTIENLSSLGNGPSKTLKARRKVFLNAPLSISFPDKNIKFAQNGKSLLPLSGPTELLTKTNLEVTGSFGAFAIHAPFYQENSSKPETENYPLNWRLNQPDKNQPDFQMDFLVGLDNLQTAKYPIKINSDTIYYDETADGRIGGKDASSYATARSTSNYCEAGESSHLFVGQTTPQVFGNYEVIRAFLSFDTSGIPDNATVLSATLYIKAGTEDNSAQDYLIQIYRYAWQEPLCTYRESNFDGAYGGSAVFEGTFRNTADGWVANTYYSMSLNTGGLTRLVIANIRLYQVGT